MPDDLKKGLASLARDFIRQHPAEATRRLDAMPVGEVARLLNAEPARYAVPVVERLSPSVAADVLVALPAEITNAIVTSMDPARTVVILGWMEETRKAALLKSLDQRMARDLGTMLDFPPDTAGRLMDPRVLGFRRGTTAAEAMARLRAFGRQQVTDVFLIDDDSRLVGRIPLQMLALAGPQTVLDGLALPPLSVTAIASQPEVVEILTERWLASLPVVDFEGRLIGVIGHDTLVATAQRDAAGDMQAMVGASRQERALSRVSFAVQKRLPWLQINLATAFLAAAVVGIFESTIAQFTALAVLLPVVAGQSGNTGAQALAVTMRGLALREIRVGQWPRVSRKEVSVALINGVAVALVTAAGVFLWSGSEGLSLVIGVSMILSMVAAGLAGVLIPVTLTSLGQDPAQSSSIILTTITDVIGFSSFLGIATLLSGML